MAERLGVLGGSFNPVHLGHIHIAQQSREWFDLARILFVVASVPPHKPPQQLIPFVHRYAMVTLATSGFPGFIPSMVETEPPASPYSMATLAKLAQRYGIAGQDMYFIAGGDSLRDVAGWYSAEELLVSYNFIFIMRPGIDAADLSAALPPAAAARIVDCRGLDSAAARARVAAELSVPECRIFIIDAGAPDIAASQIRSMISQGRSIDDLVPAQVSEYIQKLNLYGDR
jgi:nicotinate-nucleotide adenylyltransferase